MTQVLRELPEVTLHFAIVCDTLPFKAQGRVLLQTVNFLLSLPEATHSTAGCSSSRAQEPVAADTGSSPLSAPLHVLRVLGFACRYSSVPCTPPIQDTGSHASSERIWQVLGSRAVSTLPSPHV